MVFLREKIIFNFLEQYRSRRGPSLHGGEGMKMAKINPKPSLKSSIGRLYYGNKVITNMNVIFFIVFIQHFIIIIQGDS